MRIHLGQDKRNDHYYPVVMIKLMCRPMHMRPVTSDFPPRHLDPPLQGDDNLRKGKDIQPRMKVTAFTESTFLYEFLPPGESGQVVESRDCSTAVLFITGVHRHLNHSLRESRDAGRRVDRFADRSDPGIGERTKSQIFKLQRPGRSGSLMVFTHADAIE